MTDRRGVTAYAQWKAIPEKTAKAVTVKGDTAYVAVKNSDGEFAPISAVLKASDKPVEIQLVGGELTVMVGKRSSLSVDLTKALKTGERIVVKLENGVLKLYDKYNKPIDEN